MAFSRDHEVLIQCDRFALCYWSALWSVWKRFHLWQIWVLSEWRWTSSGNWFIQVCFIYLNDPLVFTTFLVNWLLTHRMIYFLLHFSNLFRVFGCSEGSTEATTLEASKNPMRYIWEWIKETCVTDNTRRFCFSKYSKFCVKHSWWSSSLCQLKLNMTMLVFRWLAGQTFILCG
jgi:hypothetical protein